MDQFTDEIKAGLDPNNDRIGISFQHPDLMVKSIDVPLQRPANLTGLAVCTRIRKMVQRGYTLLLDGKMCVVITVAHGVKDSGYPQKN